MKSQRRHDLQTNELADALGRLGQRLRPHARTVVVIAGLAVILVVVLIWLPLMQRRAAAEAAYAFDAAVRSGGAEALRSFLAGYPEAEQKVAARLLLADRLLQDVANGRVEADEADATLDEAKTFYTQVAEASDALKPMARTGLALVMLQRGDLEAGRKALEQVAEDWPQSVAAARAEVHLEALAGYEPVAFSDEPLEKPPAPEGPPASAEEAAPAIPTPEAAAPAAPGAPPSEEEAEGKSKPVG